MRESNSQVMVPSAPVTNGNSPSKIEKARNLFRGLKNPPQPHMCIQDFLVNSCNPCFINVLSWSKLSTPVNPLDPIPLYGGMKVINHSTNALKLTISNYSDESEISQHPDVFAVMAHPEVLRVSGKNCTDDKDRDAFIDLMLDFIEAMNPGIKFQRKFIVLGDRDLAGELKDIWHTVHNKRQREKMNHSCHGEGDISYFNNRQNSAGTTVRISKQTTKNMAELSVKELCSAVDATLINSTNSSSHKPKSWLFNGQSHERSGSVNGLCFKDVVHEEKIVGGMNNNLSSVVSFPMPSPFPLTLNTSLSSSSLEISPAFHCSKKKAIKEDSSIDQTFKHVISPQIVCAEPFQELFPCNNILSDAISLHASSEVLIPFSDDIEDKPHLKFPMHKSKAFEAKVIPCDDITRRKGKEKCPQHNQLSSQSSMIMYDDSLQEQVTYEQLPIAIQPCQPTVSPTDDVERGIVIYQQQHVIPPANQVLTVFESAVHGDVACEHQIVLSADRPVLDVFQDIVHANITHKLHSALSPANQPVVTMFEDIVDPDAACKQHPVTPKTFQPVTMTFENVVHTNASCKLQPFVPLAKQTVEDVMDANTSPTNRSVITMFEDLVHEQHPVAPPASINPTVVIMSDDAVQWDATNQEFSLVPVFDLSDMIHCEQGYEACEELNAAVHQTTWADEETPYPITQSSPGLTNTTPLKQSNVEVIARITKRNLDCFKSEHALEFVSSLSEERSSEETDVGVSEGLNENPDLPLIAESVIVEGTVADHCRAYSLGQDSLNNTLENKCNPSLHGEVYSSAINSHIDGEVDENSECRLEVDDSIARGFLNTQTNRSTSVSAPTTLESKVSRKCANSVEILQSDKLLEDGVNICLGEINKVIITDLSGLEEPCSVQVPGADDVASCNQVVNTKQAALCDEGTSKTVHISEAENLGTVSMQLQKIFKSPRMECNDPFVLSPHNVRQKTRGTSRTINATSQTTLPIIATPCFKLGRQNASGDIRSTKETLPHPSVSGTKVLSGVAVVSEKPKSKTSPVQKQPCMFNGFGHIDINSPRNSTSLTNRSQNVGVRVKHQGIQKSPHVGPTAVTNTTILQSFGVLVPKENAPRRTDRKRNCKLSDLTHKPLVDTTFLPFSAGFPKRTSEMKIDRSSKKNAAKSFTPTDSLHNKPRPPCDKNCRTLRRSLSENNKNDKSTNLITNGANINPVESSKAHSIRRDTLSRDVLKTEAVQQGMPCEAFTTAAHKCAKEKLGRSVVHRTDLSELAVSDKTAVHNCPISRVTGFSDLKTKNNCSSTCTDVPKITNLRHFETGPHFEDQATVRVETPQCCKIVAERASLLNGSKDTRLSSTECHQRSFVLTEKALISTDTSKKLSHDEILAIENNCPQPKTEFQSHQDSAHCAPETACSESIPRSSLSL